MVGTSTHSVCQMSGELGPNRNNEKGDRNCRKHPLGGLERGNFSSGKEEKKSLNQIFDVVTEHSRALS